MTQSFDFDALLSAIPVANTAVRMERREHGMVLFVPLRERVWTRLARLVLPLRSERGFALDRLGEEVWQACDGKRTLEAIVDTLSLHDALPI